MTAFLTVVFWAIVFLAALVFDSVMLFIVWCAMLPFVVIFILASLF
jgi:hypothetical protein